MLHASRHQDIAKHDGSIARFCEEWYSTLLAHLSIDIPTHLPLGTRLVWILARPLEGRIIRSVSSGNFPLCHWMVFISDHDIEFERIKRILEDLRTHDLSQYDHIRLGMVHQMYRDPTSNTTVRAAEIFSTLNLIGKYATASIAYAGKTRFTDPEIDTFGVPFTSHR